MFGTFLRFGSTVINLPLKRLSLRIRDRLAASAVPNSMYAIPLGYRVYLSVRIVTRTIRPHS